MSKELTSWRSAITSGPACKVTATPPSRRGFPHFARDVLDASRLIAIINPQNVPSQRVAAKIGLKIEKRAAAASGADALIYAGNL